MIYKKFETEMTVRPSEIDYNKHVHQSAFLSPFIFFCLFHFFLFGLLRF
jgi:hypothetical protein